MNVTDFMQNLANGENYETTIYQWSIHLFDEGKSIEEAIKVIQERKAKVMFNSGDASNTYKDVSILRNHQKVINSLKAQPTYLNLSDNQKEKIVGRVDALVETRLYSASEIIQLVLGIINHITMKTQPKANKNKINPSNNKPMFFSEYRYRMCI
jgi:hypothetical protein